MGYRTYVVSNEKPAPVELAADEKAGVIESPFFKATLDAKRGRIASLIDKRTRPRTGGRRRAAGLRPVLLRAIRLQGTRRLDRQVLVSAVCGPQDDLLRLRHAAQTRSTASALPENMTLAVKKTAIDVTAVMTGTIPGPGRPQQMLDPPDAACRPAGGRPGNRLAEAARRLAGGRLDLPAVQVQPSEVPPRPPGRRRGPGEGHHRGERQLSPVLGQHRRGGVRRRHRRRAWRSVRRIRRW